jgi:hypothetical protein
MKKIDVHSPEFRDIVAKLSQPTEILNSPPRQKAFSGIKDVDKLILHKLDDRDLLSTFLTNKYVLGLCDETFFRNRLYEKFPKTAQFKDEKTSWKNYYLTIITKFEFAQKEYKSLVKLNEKFKNLKPGQRLILPDGQTLERNLLIIFFNNWERDNFNMFSEKEINQMRANILKKF